jgi:mono/diheme cytochrome c family protein
LNPKQIGGRTPRQRLLLGGLLFSCLAVIGCNWEMRDDSRIKPLEPSPAFNDRRSSRPIEPGTVARTNLRIDRSAATAAPPAPNGLLPDGQPTNEFPYPITRELLARGQNRYNIYCSMCHARDGAGNGMVVQRGFPPPPSYHIERLRRAPVGHFYDVITNGYGVMYSFSDRVQDPADRWAIAAYIRVLQLSQNAGLEDVPPEELQKMQGVQP